MTIAFFVAVAGIVVDIAVGTALLLSDHKALRDLTKESLTSAGMPTTDSDIDSYLNLMRVAGIVGALVAFGVLFLFAWKMRAGRNWARIVLTALTAYNVVSFLGSAATTEIGLSFVWNATSIALSIATVVYMFRPDANAFFKAHQTKKPG